MSQPNPTPNSRPHIADLVIQDIAARKELGLAKYGVPLQPFNGRNALQDLYEELLDAAKYIKQRIVEDEESRKHDGSANRPG